MTTAADQPHPRGLYLLFTAEMWERMSYYGMRALLTLYMTSAVAKGGFGWADGTSLRIYGWYCGLVYLTPLIGGALTDRYLGQRKAVLIGGILMMLGHFLMAVPGYPAFFGALSLLIVGNGFFKPNISTMVGALYKTGDPRRDSAFTIFYIGINVGAFLAPLVCGTLGEKVGFHWGFASAGVGMGLGLVVYLLGAPKLLGDIGKEPSRRRANDAPNRQDPDNRQANDPSGTAPTLSPVELDGIKVIAVLAIFSIFFWVAFEQAGGLMNLYTDRKVDRHVFGWEIPTTWFQALNPFFIVTLGAVSPSIWRALRARNAEPSTPKKFALGLLFLSFGFVLMVVAAKQSAATGLAALGWIVGAYFFHTVGELCLSPIGLSMVTKLAPVRMASLLMGVWFFANFFSDTAAGYLGGYSERLGEVQLFTSIVVATGAAGVLLWALSGILTRWMHGRD